MKLSISYNGGVLYGYAHNALDQKATAMLGVMVKCMFGSKRYLAKIIPCKALNSQYQNQIVRKVIFALEKNEGTLLAIISDNNGVNVKFFHMFHPISREIPWKVNRPTARQNTRPAITMGLISHPDNLLPH